VQQSFYKVAMRPGKPLMAGRLGHSVVLGLPGNPVSAMVCGYVFLLPMLRKMAGLPAAHSPTRRAALLAPLGANGARTHYMRARFTPEGITAFPSQDSALLRVLSDANALVIRPVGDPARAVGEMVDYMPLESE
jgi:molybdopterin molybdotransferase